MRLNRWAEGRDVVDRLLRERMLERVTASEEMAEHLLEVAAQHVDSAALIAHSDPSGSCQLSYDGSRKALAAVLQIQGLRPTSAGGHLVIEQCLKAQLVQSGRGIVDKFSVMRRARNNSEYPSQPNGAAETADALEQIEDAKMVLDAAAKLVAVMPVYGMH